MSFLTTYYPKRIEFELKGKNVFLRPPEYKDWKAYVIGDEQRDKLSFNHKNLKILGFINHN